jgi:hypothetical protein
LNIYLKNELVKELIEAGVKDIPEFAFQAIKEKLQKEERKP